MQNKTKTIVFGFLGSKLDSGATEKRWAKWRPTVSLCAQADFHVDRLELFINRSDHKTLADIVINDLAQVSPETEVVVNMLDMHNPWELAPVYGALHDFALSYAFDDEANYYVHWTTGSHTAQACLFMLTESRHFPARMVDTSYATGAKGEALWRGEYTVIDLDLSSYDLLASRFGQEKETGATLLKGGIPTRNAAFNELISDIEKVALRSSEPLLLTGPTGAGKSQLAKRIYELRSHRHLIRGPFIEVNCATLRGDNAMSTLFGHTKGAFTGAIASRDGMLKAADGGTLFLDEIGTLNIDEQALLLRALEDKVFYPVGSDKAATSEFQLVVGTNLDLSEEVAAGRFREDLFARMNVWSFRLPGLAERREDIEPNLDFELRRVSTRLNQKVSINREARELYLNFALTAPWNGNFRDLAASVMRMGTLASGGRIIEADVKHEMQELNARWGLTNANKRSKEMATPSHRGSLVSKVFADGQLDLFDIAGMEVVLAAIADTASMAEAGRRLFAVSRAARVAVNDSDRVKKYLQRWNLTYADVKERVASVSLR